MQGKCNERKNSPPITFKKEQTNKQTNKKAKTKQNKSLVSIPDKRDQLCLGLVPNCSQASADLQQRADLPCWRNDLPLFLQQRGFVIFMKSEKVSDYYSTYDFVYW